MALDGKLAILAAAVILPLTAGTQGQSITWGQPVRLAGNGNGHVATVTCPTTTDCIAMEPGGDIISWNGTHWSQPGPGIKGASGIVSLSCPTATFCAAAGDNADGDLWIGHGTTWTLDAPAGSQYDWGSVSCTSALFCAAATVDGYISTFNGHTWSAPVRLDPDAPDNFMVSCSYATRCFAMGSLGEMEQELFEWNGKSWTLLPLSNSLDKYASLACAPTGFCMISDAGAFYVSSSGSTWKQLPAGGPPGANPALNCTSSKFCMFYGLTAYLYDGSGWRQFSTPPVVTQPDSEGLACAGQTCVAVANMPNSSASIYRGGKWGAETSIDNSGELDSVSCLSSGFCATAGMSWDAVIRQPGQHWGSTAGVSGANGIGGVSCTSPKFCLLVNGGGYSWRYDGTGWVRAPSLADIGRANDSQSAASCVSPGFCASAGTGLSAYDGTRWTKPVQAQFPDFWTSVSCTSATFCVAMNTIGDYSVFNGKDWSLAKNTSTGLDWWLSADCVSPHFCAASGMAEVATFDGTTWTIDRTVTSANASVHSVTCTSADFCLAMDQTGHAFTFNGTQWSPAGDLRLKPGAVLESVACSAPTSCVAVDSLGNVTIGS